MVIGEITLDGVVLTLQRQKYISNGRVAVTAWYGDGLYGSLSANVPNAEIGDGEFAVKNYSENVRLARAAGRSGLFSDTGRTCVSGFCELPIWRIRS